MREFLRGLNPLHVLLLLVAFVFGVFFRTAYLGAQAPWDDELATWYFVRHLDVMLQQEQNTPLYYYLLKLVVGSEPGLSAIRLVSGLLSVLHLLVAWVLGRRVFSGEKFVLFWLLVCLNPIDIVHARQARNYAWYLDCVLLFWLWVRVRAPIWWLSVLSLLNGFIHVFTLIPMALTLWLERPRRWWLPVLTSLGVWCYYLSVDRLAARIGWNKPTKFVDYFLRLGAQLLGDAYPRNQFFSVGLLGPIFLGLLVAYFLWRRSKGGNLFLLSLLAGIAAIELAQVFANYRVERYLLYLSAAAIVGICDSVQRPRPLVAFVLLLSLLHWHPPLEQYPWTDQWIAHWKETRKAYPTAAYLVCHRAIHRTYYELEGPSCFRDVTPAHLSGPLLVFNLDGSGTPVLLGLSKYMDVNVLGDRIYYLQPRKTP